MTYGMLEYASGRSLGSKWIYLVNDVITFYHMTKISHLFLVGNAWSGRTPEMEPTPIQGPPCGAPLSTRAFV